MMLARIAFPASSQDPPAPLRLRRNRHHLQTKMPGLRIAVVADLKVSASLLQLFILSREPRWAHSPGLPRPKTRFVPSTPEPGSRSPDVLPVRRAPDGGPAASCQSHAALVTAPPSCVVPRKDGIPARIRCNRYPHSHCCSYKVLASQTPSPSDGLSCHTKTLAFSPAAGHSLNWVPGVSGELDAPPPLV